MCEPVGASSCREEPIETFYSTRQLDSLRSRSWISKKVAGCEEVAGDDCLRDSLDFNNVVAMSLVSTLVPRDVSDPPVRIL